MPVKLTYGTVTFFHARRRCDILVERRGLGAFRAVGAKLFSGDSNPKCVAHLRRAEFGVGVCGLPGFGSYGAGMD